MKRTAISVLALSGALALGACGSETAPTGAASPSAGTAQDAAAPSVGDTVALSEIGADSAAAVEAEGTAHMTMDLGAGGTAEADVDYRGSSPTMSMTMSADGEDVRMVYIDQVMYMGGESFSEMTGGKTWIKIDPEGDDMMSRVMGPVLGQMESTIANPTGELATLEGAEATVTAVEGGLTTYSVELTPEQLKQMVQKQAATIPGLDEADLEKMLESDKLPEGITYELTLDAQGLPTTITTAVQDQSAEITYSKWGEPVDIAAPPAAEVGTFEMPHMG